MQFIRVAPNFSLINFRILVLLDPRWGASTFGTVKGGAVLVFFLLRRTATAATNYICESLEFQVSKSQEIYSKVGHKSIQGLDPTLNKL